MESPIVATEAMNVMPLLRPWLVVLVSMAMGCGAESGRDALSSGFGEDAGGAADSNGSASAGVSVSSTESGGTGPSSDSETPMDPSSDSDASASGTGGDDGHETAASAGDDGSVKFDLPIAEEGSAEGPMFDLGSSDDGGASGCGKIDFLFAIDNSTSMANVQAKLIANIGPFIDTIVANVQAQDYHLMVVDSDACVDGSGGSGPPECFAYPGCEQMLGAGQVRDCGVPNPPRFLTSDLPINDIKWSFECAANVGASGSATELTFTAIEEALTTHNAATGCNPGFVRQDAILVVIVITDDHTGWIGTDNANSIGSPGQWYDTILAAKGNKPENVVVLGFIPTIDGPKDCLGFWADGRSDRFIEFMNLWGDHGITASVCEPDYTPFFQRAVDLIDWTCGMFLPPD